MSKTIMPAALSTIAAAVKFRLFISCAPRSSRWSDENDEPSHHCSLGRRNGQMIIDGLDAKYIFDSDSGRLLFVVRSDETPQIDCPVMDSHIEHRWPPQFSIQSGEHLVTDSRIAGACSG